MGGLRFQLLEAQAAMITAMLGMAMGLALTPAAAGSPAPADPAAARQRLRLEQVRQAYGFKNPFTKDQLRQVGNLIIFDSNLREYQRRHEERIRDYRKKNEEEPRPFPGMDTLSQSVYTPRTLESLRLNLAATLAKLRLCALENFNAGRPISCLEGDSARVEGEGAIAIDPDSYAANGALAEGGGIACGKGASAVGDGIAIGDGSHAEGGDSLSIAVGKDAVAGPRGSGRVAVEVPDAAQAVAKYCGPNPPARLTEELRKVAAQATSTPAR